MRAVKLQDAFSGSQDRPVRGLDQAGREISAGTRYRHEITYTRHSMEVESTFHRLKFPCCPHPAHQHSF